MTRLNRIVAACFLGALALVAAVVIAAAIAVDVWLARRKPAGSTISWSMALLGKLHPGSLYALGFFCGFLACGAFVALPVHFWGGMDSPDDWAELERLRAEKAAGAWKGTAPA